MIIPAVYAGKTIGVFGLARSGIAAARALQAAGARVVGFDDRFEARDAYDFAEDFEVFELGQLDALILSPGVPLTHPEPHAIVKRAQKSGIPILGDFDLFLETRPSLPAHKLVGVTGTNGKSTTTALLAHVVASSGTQSVAFGNIGLPFLGVEPLASGGVYVAELSSFQIDLSPVPRVDIGVLLNLSADHIDRHGSMQGYAAAKARLVQNGSKDQTNIISLDDTYSSIIAENASGYVIPISVKGVPAHGIGLEYGTIVDATEGERMRVGDLSEFKTLQGAHNHQNILAVYAVAKSLGLSADAIMDGLRSFKGLEHRQEYVATLNGAQVVNDSKATNWDSAKRALSTFDHIRWIAGGRAKGAFEAIADDSVAHVEKAYLYGEAAPAISASLPNFVTRERFDLFDDAAHAAFQDARAEETILLAPAATAFDQFKNFEMRGDHFKSLAQSYMAEAVQS